MKNLLFLVLVLCTDVKAQFQLPSGMKFQIEIDSIDENRVFFKQFKAINLADTTLTFMLVTAKVNGTFNANQDSSEFNFNVTFEGKLDSAKGIKNLERRLKKDAENEVRRQESQLRKLYEKNKDVTPQLKEKAAAAKIGLINNTPKGYSLVATNSDSTRQIISPIVEKKRKWYQRKK